MLSTILSALAVLVGLPGATLSALLLFEKLKRKRKNSTKTDSKTDDTITEDDALA